MARLRTVVVGGAALALMAVSLAMPAAAADTKGTLAIVNGVPGKRVDVCLNGSEIKSNLAFGGHVFKDVIGTGSKNLKFYEHDPRTCRGAPGRAAELHPRPRRGPHDRRDEETGQGRHLRQQRPDLPRRDPTGG